MNLKCFGENMKAVCAEEEGGGGGAGPPRNSSGRRERRPRSDRVFSLEVAMAREGRPRSTAGGLLLVLRGRRHVTASAAVMISIQCSYLNN